MRRIFGIAILVPSLASILSIQPAAAGNPTNLVISNVCDTGFVVSWLTVEAETGQVHLISGAIFNDDRGANFSGITHYVTLAGLKANHTYSFYVRSGGQEFDHIGAPWRVVTGASLEPRPPDLIFGQVKNSDGSNAFDAIVYSTIDRLQEGAPSAPLSTLVPARDGGFFSLDLGETRTLFNPGIFFAYAINEPYRDSVTLKAVGSGGGGVVTFDMADVRLRETDPGSALIIQLVSANQETPRSATQKPAALASLTCSVASTTSCATPRSCPRGILLMR